MTTVLLPTVTIAPKRVEPVAHPCGMVDKAAQLAIAIMTGTWQRRERLECDMRLIRAAQWKADAMRDRGWFGHKSPEGEWSNALVRRFGFRLPDKYNSENQTESLAWGFADMPGVLVAFEDSEGHWDHIAGRGTFFAAQDRIGIGYAAGGVRSNYWVVLIAEAI